MEAQYRAEKTKYEADMARWQAESARIAFETERINLNSQLDGVYSFYREVTQKSCNKLLSAMKLWHDEFPKGPWTIYLNSVGGGIVPGTALLDELMVHSLRGGGTHEVTIKVRGEAASMASVLLQAADRRLIGPSSQMMIHEPSSFAEGTVHTIKAEADWLLRWWNSACVLFASRANMTVGEIKRAALKQDWWLTADQAVEKGFADEVG
jgi:ATP-dependent protease ClpP protease subunit